MERVISRESVFNGRRILWDRDGYPYGWLPNHPMARKKSWKGYVPLHRYFKSVDEKRVLSIDEIVHHINGRKEDERRENLIILTRSAHSILHKKIDCGICTLDEAKDFESILRIVNEPIKKRKCSECGAELWYKECSVIPIYLCQKCIHKKMEKAKWPTDEELQNMILTKTYSGIARELGVTVQAVRKRMKTHNLIDPHKHKTYKRK